MSWAAIITSIVALIVSASGIAGASSSAGGAKAAGGSRTQSVARARVAEGLTASAQASLVKRIERTVQANLAPSCPRATVDLGSWCVMPLPYAVPSSQTGLNDYVYATQVCQKLGGYLPSAAQLIGAAPLIRLESTIHDNPATSLIEADPTQGLKDQREMTSTLVTTAAGSDAAGSEGVSEGSTGNPALDEPDPTPEPADPYPETLQYVTVYDNGNKGGFAGSEPISYPENFRCGFDKVAGGSASTQVAFSASGAG